MSADDIINAPIDDSYVEYIWGHRGKDSDGNWLDDPFPPPSLMAEIMSYFKKNTDIIRIEIENDKFKGQTTYYPMMKIYRNNSLNGCPQIVCYTTKLVHGELDECR